MLVANPLVVDTGTPPIPEARGWLAAYDGRHGPPINLSQAAPGLPPPPALLHHLQQAASDPTTAAYGPILGDDVLREAYAADLSRATGGHVAGSEIAITAGCNQAFICAVLAVAKAGDAIILPEPWYFNHAMVLQMLGIRCVPLPCRAEDGFVPDPERLTDLLAAYRPKAVVLVTPNNPTGAIIPPAIVTRIAAATQRASAWLLLDETYREFLPTADARPHALFADADASAHVVHLYSFSKSYAVPGHRIGAMRVPPILAGELLKVLDCVQICAPRAAQRALGWAIGALSDWREANRADIVARGAAFAAAMVTQPGWTVRAIGAYFAYVEATGAVADDATPDAGAIARRLATERGVLVLPGTYFGGPTQRPYLRFAFANSDAAGIADAVRRLQPNL